MGYETIKLTEFTIKCITVKSNLNYVKSKIFLELFKKNFPNINYLTFVEV